MKCKYVATLATNLKRHVEYKHKGVIYPCSQCEFAATTARYLKTHVESKHGGVRYLCLHCQFAATTASNHVESKH